MHPRIREALAFLDANHAAFHGTVNAVPQTDREKSPAPDHWSVAQIVQHLAIVETRLATLLRTKLADAQRSGLPPERERSSIIDPADVAVIIDRSRRIEAPETARPPANVSFADAASAYDVARTQLREIVEAADGLALGNIVAPNPALGPANFYRWLTFIGAHEARHTAQIREAAARLRQ